MLLLSVCMLNINKSRGSNASVLLLYLVESIFNLNIFYKISPVLISNQNTIKFGDSLSFNVDIFARFGWEINNNAGNLKSSNYVDLA